MSISSNNTRNLILLLIIIVVTAALRIASFHNAGPFTAYSPIGAMALFGGTYFRGNIKPYLFPVLTLLISDVIVSFTVFDHLRVGLLYAGWYWTYIAFALMAIAAKFIIKEVNVKNIIIAIVVATVIHWLIADLSMCVVSNTLTPAGYAKALVDAIPFELKFMAGTAFFSLIMFGGFELLQKKFPKLQFS